MNPTCDKPLKKCSQFFQRKIQLLFFFSRLIVGTELISLLKVWFELWQNISPSRVAACMLLTFNNTLLFTGRESLGSLGAGQLIQADRCGLCCVTRAQQIHLLSPSPGPCLHSAGRGIWKCLAGLSTHWELSENSHFKLFWYQLCGDLPFPWEHVLPLGSGAGCTARRINRGRERRRRHEREREREGAREGEREREAVLLMNPEDDSSLSQTTS